TRPVSVSPDISKVRTTGSSLSRPSSSTIVPWTSAALSPVRAETSRLAGRGSNSWQPSMPPPKRRSHHHVASTPVKFSWTSVVAASARSSLRYSGTDGLYQPRALTGGAWLQYNALWEGVDHASRERFDGT